MSLYIKEMDAFNITSQSPVKRRWSDEVCRRRRWMPEVPVTMCQFRPTPTMDCILADLPLPLPPSILTLPSAGIATTRTRTLTRTVNCILRLA